MEQEQIIRAPDEGWITYVAKMWLLASQLSQTLLSEELDGTPADLARLQRLLDSGAIASTQTQQLQALGIAFGKIFVNTTANYDWWVVKDEYGEDICVRYKETTLLTFPQTMISKRVEDGQAVNVQDLFAGLVEKLEQVRQQNYAGE